MPQKDDAAAHYDLTQKTIFDLYGVLLGQVVQKEEYVATCSRQEAEIAFLEGSGTELLEAASQTLVRQKAKLAATDRGVKVCDQSINIVAGTILQIAKQAIAIRHGSERMDCTTEGRLISGSCVRDLIWLGRNQAMHFEDTKPGSSWVKLFNTLNGHNAPMFSLAPPFESRAMAILDLLGWLRYEQYTSDMRDLGIHTDPDANI